MKDLHKVFNVNSVKSAKPALRIIFNTYNSKVNITAIKELFNGLTILPPLKNISLKKFWLKAIKVPHLKNIKNAYNLSSVGSTAKKALAKYAIFKKFISDMAVITEYNPRQPKLMPQKLKNRIGKPNYLPVF